jgi:3-hydroxybutyryl-CoA dehydrogenase
MDPQAPVTTLALVGGGTMGTSFAQLFALGGLRCRLSDASAEAAGAARERTIRQATVLAEAGLLADDAPDRIAAAVTSAASTEAAVEGADFVLEAVPEDVAVKLETLQRIESAAGPEIPIATNTSAIPITQLAAELAAPERFLGAHFFNPPLWVPCVELISGPATDPAVVERFGELLRAVGKRPVAVRDAAGFVANRIQFAMFREAAAVVDEGIASPEDVDAIVSSSFGFRLPFYGPFAIADMAGLDVYEGAYEALDQAHGLAAPPALGRQIEAGRFGVKRGGGFTMDEMSDDRAAAASLRRDRSYAALRDLVDELQGADR